MLLEFDAETTRLLEACYLGADISARRRANFDALRPAPGETIVDLGCGNGLLSLELGRAVGARGQVIGVDPSTDMLAAGQERCSELDWIDLRQGTAQALPLPDNSVDAVVSVQVLEYIADLEPVLAEVARVLKPGGRLVVGDMHFDTWAWFSQDRARMARMIEAWDQHLALREVPALLPALLQEAGLAVEDVRPLSMTDHVLKPDGLAAMLMALMSRYALANKLLPEDDVNAWLDEQRSLAAEGRFFFSITHVVTAARAI